MKLFTYSLTKSVLTPLIQGQMKLFTYSLIKFVLTPLINPTYYDLLSGTVPALPSWRGLFIPETGRSDPGNC